MMESSGFAFHEDPFDPLPNPKFARGTTPHAQALSAVMEALRQRDAVTIVTGGEGSGKTTLCLALPQHVEPRVVTCSVLRRPDDEEGLLCNLLDDLGIAAAAGRPARSGLVDRYNALVGSLLSLAAADTKIVVIIDNADDLPGSAWEAVVRLINFAANHSGVLQIVLVGRPRLEEVLQEPALHRILERVVSRHELAPFPGREVKGLIERRLWIARGGVASLSAADAPSGGPCPRFTRGAVGVIASQSSGNPRVINEICGRALEIARQRDASRIGVRTALRAASQLGLRSGWLALLAALPRIVGAILVALTTIFFSTWWVSGDENVPEPKAATAAAPPRPVSGAASAGDFQRFRSDILDRATTLSRDSDVRALLQLQEQVKQFGSVGSDGNPSSTDKLLLELEGLTDQARLRQLARDRELILKHEAAREVLPPPAASQ
jgi:type II secretory pathway predicted ATPase ExeA